VALALYVLYESGSTLIRHEPPERSIPGIIVAVSLVVMPSVGTSEAPGCCRDRERSNERLIQTSRFLHVPVCDPVGRLAPEWLFGWWWAEGMMNCRLLQYCRKTPQLCREEEVISKIPQPTGNS